MMTKSKEKSSPRILVLGAGYGGLITAQGLAKHGLSVTLVNKHDYHQIITQIHEPAAGCGYGDDVRIHLGELIPSSVQFIKGVVKSILPEVQQVLLEQDFILEYDYLVLALGSEPEFFGVPGLAEHSFPLRSLNAARMIKVQIESCLARHKVDPQDESLLNFVVGGAGFTGIEIAGELAEWLPKVAQLYDVSLHKIRLICAEAAAQVLPGFDPFLSETTAELLKSKGIEFKLGSPICEVTDKYAVISGEKIPTQTVIWTGGVRGNRLLSGFTNQRGRAEINDYLQSVDYSNIFIIGDCALTRDDAGKVLPPTAQLAIQQGQHLVNNLLDKIKDQGMTQFQFHNKGVVASIGRKDAVGLILGRYRLEGYWAVMMKQVVNLRYLFIIGGIPLVIKKLLRLCRYKQSSTNEVNCALERASTID